jgi:hypothetical protein
MTATDNPSARSRPSSDEAITRRTWLGGAAIAGAAVVGGAIAGGGVASASDGGWRPRREQLTVEVACIGETWREQRFHGPGIDPADRRGSPVAVEGWIYPEGHIPGEGFIPTEDGSIGRWFCNGWILISADRPEPHLNARAMFVFGSIIPEQLFPEDVIASAEIGGTFSQQSSFEPITGGTGRYFGVQGQIRRHNHSRNSTLLYGTDVAAFNFVYDFDLLHFT